MSGDGPGGALPPLKLTCMSTKCEENKHCFLPGPKPRKRKGDSPADAGTGAAGASKFLHPEHTGKCWKCDAAPIDWGRIHRREIKDAAYTVECLKLELFRDHYWTIEIDEQAVAHARRKGFAGMQEAVERRMRSKPMSCGVTPGTPTFDGRQTPLSGNAVFYAQHATATCCRKCMEVWHRIPRDRDLNEAEIQYLAGLNMVYVRERLPYLTETGETVPSSRKPSGVGKDT